MTPIARSENQVIREIAHNRFENSGPVVSTYEVLQYPQYKVVMKGNNNFWIIKEGEPEPYISTFYSSVYAATKGICTIEDFKTMVRAKQEKAKEAKQV